MRVAAGFGLDDARFSRAPVLIPQQPLVELAGLAPGQLGLEVDRAGALDAREVLAAPVDEFSLELGAGLGGVY